MSNEALSYEALMAIQNAVTDDFLELAALGGLDIMTDFSGTDLSGVKLENADLSGADFSRADLSKANLMNVKLIGANLRGTDLRDANLEGADLSNADLTDANLQGANLRKASLLGAVLQVETMIGADFEGAIFAESGIDGHVVDGIVGPAEPASNDDYNRRLLKLFEACNALSKEHASQTEYLGVIGSYIREVEAEITKLILDSAARQAGEKTDVLKDLNDHTVELMHTLILQADSQQTLRGDVEAFMERMIKPKGRT
jgi:uncharacterized protein YjbI with pentapeptide repeats